MSLSYERLIDLKEIVTRVPETVDSKTIWSFLGWGEEHELVYCEVLERYGIDLRPMAAPNYADIVSILVKNNLNWEEVIYPKARLISAIESELEGLKSQLM